MKFNNSHYWLTILVLPLILSGKIAIKIHHDGPAYLAEFDPHSPEGFLQARLERQYWQWRGLPVPAWAAPFRDREAAEHQWSLDHIPGWEVYPVTWPQDIYGNDIGGRHGYLVRNEARLRDWLDRGQISPWWAVTRGYWLGPGTLYPNQTQASVLPSDR